MCGSSECKDRFSSIPDYKTDDMFVGTILMLQMGFMTII